MSRTWLLRGAAVAVLGVLVGAWTGGLVGTGETAPPASKPNNVALTESSAARESEDPAVFEQAAVRRARGREASRAALTEPSPSATVSPTDPASSDPTTSDPTSDVPTPDQPSPSDKPDKPSDPPTPSEPGPSGPPTQPSEECTELVEVLDCVLDPITGAP